MHPEYFDDDDDDDRSHYHGPHGLDTAYDDGDQAPGAGGLISILALMILLVLAIKILTSLFQ